MSNWSTANPARHCRLPGYDGEEGTLLHILLTSMSSLRQEARLFHAGATFLCPPMAFSCFLLPHSWRRQAISANPAIPLCPSNGYIIQQVQPRPPPELLLPLKNVEFLYSCVKTKAEKVQGFEEPTLLPKNVGSLS